MTFSGRCRYALLTAALLLSIAVPFAACRADQGTAIISAENGQLILQVNLPTPPPVNLIAQMKLQSQAKIVSASPSAAKIDPDKSLVKWLVKNPRPGKLRFSVTTSPPVTSSSASGLIIYRNPGDGNLVRIQAGKR